MNRLPALLAAAAAASALAYGSDKEDVTVVGVTLEPGQAHEECTRVEAGQKRRYHWSANAPVDFNIHYHREAEVFYPVRRERMRGDGGTFAAKSSEDYCWMWTAKNAAAKVTGRIENK